jgi:hypothetical protein
LVIDLDCFLLQDGGAAGEAQSGSELRAWMMASICGEIDQANWPGRSTRGKEERWEGNGEAAFIDGAGIGRRYLQGGGDSARNFAVLAAARAEK